MIKPKRCFNKYLLTLGGILMILLAGCSTQTRANFNPSESYPNPLPAYPNPGCAGQPCPESEAGVSLSGRLSIIQNGHVVYTLFDDQGTSWELLIEDSLVQPLGGIQALNGKRITVNGTWTGDTPAKLKVSSLQIIE